MSISLDDYLETEEQAEKVLNVLATYNVYKPPVPTWIIQRMMPYLTMELKSMPEEVIGFSFPNKDKSHMLLNEKYSYGALRFTAFHEFYHLLNGKLGYSKDTPQGAAEEKKADFFAACLLMPARWFRKEWEKTGGDIEKIAKIFGVSVLAAHMRALNLEHYLRKN
ncbi:MAG: hypothetical protein A3B38_04325 [Candidatus Levybacteria bacterium RIFCSPLOWO2_01_FULL_36_13]|nr:MAG: hypothetical protein A2684_00070 [Candidatus Levybacteria bacterium RIFCSPHIGHO2_01_FULL_36_15b]OGH34055.1 MAG: hypothetical protein A3B38_04325 [Candidatus Levybacteria bacterium RIFCSPLOWO2_01_FULL_36_13]